VGNFTKITQRLPVKIVVEKSALGSALRPGLSVDVKVDVRDRSGPAFAEAGLPDAGQYAQKTPSGGQAR
jgi:membrane fusion protein (multidrug efflux system)